MAEVLGVVASAVSLLTLIEQIVTGIERLKALRKSITTLPHELQDLIEEIEIVQGVLGTLTPDMFNFLNVASTERRLATFANDLEWLIIEVEKYRLAAGRKMGALKIALKREELKSQRRNLDSVKNSASIRDLNSIIRARAIERSVVTAANEFHQTSSTRIRKDKYKAKRTWEYRFRTPLFVIDKIWSLQTRRLSSGWTFSFQVHNVIPFGSPIFQYTMSGNIQEVQRMFQEGLASPYDCDPHGNNLLNYAAINRRIETCKFLLDAGTDPYLKNSGGFGPRDQVNMSSMVWFIEPDEAPLIIELYRLFFKTVDEADDLLEGLDRDERHWLLEFCGPPEALTIIQESAALDYSALPLETRFKLAMAMRSGFKRPTVLQTAMGGHIPAEAYRLKLDDGQTLLQKMAEPLLADAIAARADACMISHFGSVRTPLLAFLEMYTWNWFAIRQMKYDFTFILQIWVREMKYAGLDLEDYGAREQNLYQLGYVDLDFDMYVGTLSYRPLMDDGEYEWLPFRVIGLGYGPEVEDWKLWITNPIDELVGEFWESIERTGEVMPGTWVD
ncbi:hypothetical protein BDV18DRAFT_166865 [Aspergillus unguis]